MMNCGIVLLDIVRGRKPICNFTSWSIIIFGEKYMVRTKKPIKIYFITICDYQWVV